MKKTKDYDKINEIAGFRDKRPESVIEANKLF